MDVWHGVAENDRADSFMCRGRRGHRPGLLRITVDRHHQPFHGRVDRMGAAVHEVLAGRLQPFPVVLAEPAQDVLSGQVSLRLNHLAVEDPLDHRDRYRPNAAPPVGEPGP